MKVRRKSNLSSKINPKNFLTLSIADFVVINDEILTETKLDRQKKDTVAKKTRFAATKGIKRDITQGGIRSVGVTDDKLEVVGAKIRFAAATDTKKLHIIHSLYEWKIYPEQSEKSLFNSKIKKNVISYGEYLLEKGDYNALVVHNLDGQVIEYIIRKDAFSAIRTTQKKANAKVLLSSIKKLKK